MSEIPERVLVTGGAGYIGAALVAALAARGCTVTVLDRLIFGRAGVVDHPRVRLLVGDVRDPEAVEAAVAGQQAVVHLAFLSNDPRFELDPDLARDVNLGATAQLARCCGARGVERLVFASSASVYGRGSGDGGPLTERSPVAPLTDYAAHKLTCEGLIADVLGSRVAWTHLRAATVAGYSARQRLDLLLNRMVADALIGGRVTLRDAGAIRPFVHIADLVEAYLAILAAPTAIVAGRCFVAAGHSATVRAHGAALRGLTGCTVEEAAAGPDGRSYALSARAIAERLGVGFERGVAAVVSDLHAALAAGLLSGAPDDPRYHNLPMQKAFFA
jgi:nucleoside-diphosphate-sugar epimerase